LCWPKRDADANPDSKWNANTYADPSATPTPGSTLWSQQTSNVTTNLAAIHFLNDNEGWAAGPNATLLHTVNGGTNWTTRVLSGFDPTAGFNSVRFLDQSTGFVGGLQSIIRTTNGGSSFGGFIFTGSTTTFRNRFFPTTSSVVWAVGRTTTSGLGARAHFRYTFNADNSLSSFTHSDTGSDIPQDLYFVDSDNGWSVGSNGVIVHITNGSAATPTFATQSSGTTQQLNGIFMLDISRGWIVGNGGMALRTADGGATWTPLTTGVTNNLNDVHFKDTNNGWAVGAVAKS